MKKGQETRRAYPEDYECLRPEAQAWALARIYERAIERSKQERLATEACDGEGRTEVGHARGPTKGRPPRHSDDATGLRFG